MEYDWRLLAEFEYPDVSKDFICILCKKILYDARISACGCRFCAECIENYLENENITCPGQSEDCRDVILNLPENISKNYVVNRRILKIKIKCPISECLYNDDLINMANHLKECRKLAIRCPYFEQGCDYMSLTQDDIDKHLQKDNHISVMVSRIKSLNQNAETFKDKSKSLETKLKNAEDVIANLQNEIKEKEKTINSNEQTEKELKDLHVGFLALQKVLKDNEAAINSYKQTRKELEELRMKFKEVQNEMNDVKSILTATWGSLTTSFSLKCYKKDSIYEHNVQKFLYANGPLVVLKSYVYSGSFYIKVFMVKGDGNRENRYPVTCIVNISIVSGENGTLLVKEEKIKKFLNENDFCRFNFDKFLFSYTEFVVESSVRVLE